MNHSESCQQMGYAILKEASKPMAKRMSEAMDFMVEHTSDARWDVAERSLKIMEQPRKPSLYADKFTSIIKKLMQREFEKDMIYYSLCHDGFRV